MNKNILTLISLLIISVNTQGQNNLYWTDLADGSIYRSDLDGTNIDTIASNLGIPVGIAFDLVKAKMYWSDYNNNVIQRSDLSGSNIETLVTGLNQPLDVELDVNNNKIYWSNENGYIMRADFDGSNIDTLIHDSIYSTGNLDLDLTNNKIYWLGEHPVVIKRANLDGTNVDTVLVRNQDDDAVGFDVVSQQNRIYWSQWNDFLYFSTLDGLNIDSTFFQGNNHGIVGFTIDSLNNQIYWVDTNDNVSDSKAIRGANLDGTNVTTLITNLSSPFLIKAVLIPTVNINIPPQKSIDHFILYQNYPNPFNPETYISFQLPKNEKVKILIYNQVGQLIRRLVNEEISPGYHQITWDTKDDRGEYVANSIYLCKVTAGSFSKTIKMLLMK